MLAFALIQPPPPHVSNSVLYPRTSRLETNLLILQSVDQGLPTQGSLAILQVAGTLWALSPALAQASQAIHVPEAPAASRDG